MVGCDIAGQCKRHLHTVTATLLHGRMTVNNSPKSQVPRLKSKVDKVRLSSIIRLADDDFQLETSGLGLDDGGLTPLSRIPILPHLRRGTAACQTGGTQQFRENLPEFLNAES